MPGLIDKDRLSAEMYHEAFETDSDMQKWDSGCWIRYKMFENILKAQPAVDAVEVVRCEDCMHYCADPWGYGNCVFEGGVSRRRKDSDFCSWGEKKEDEERSF